MYLLFDAKLTSGYSIPKVAKRMITVYERFLYKIQISFKIDGAWRAKRGRKIRLGLQADWLPSPFRQPQKIDSDCLGQKILQRSLSCLKVVAYPDWGNGSFIQRTGRAHE